MFGKAVTYIVHTKKCLADNSAPKYEASVGPAENLPPTPDGPTNFKNSALVRRRPTNKPY